MSKDNKITMDKEEFWNIVSGYERLAVRHGSVRDLAKCAQLRINSIVIGVTKMSRPDELCYEEDNNTMREVYSLLGEACDIERSIRKKRISDNKKLSPAKAP